MTDDDRPTPNPFTPTPADRAAAWRVVLALLNGDVDSVIRVAHEAQTPVDVDRFLLALASNFVWWLQRACTDPIGYAEKAIAFELDEQAKQDHPDDE